MRVYPIHINQPGTPEQQKTWDSMLIAVDGWNDLNTKDKDAWKTIVRDAHRTGKDFYYRLHLKGQPEDIMPWAQISVTSWLWEGDTITIIFGTQNKLKLTANYCDETEQRKSWWWGTEGYCIRGRKMVRKRNLLETWTLEEEQQEEKPSNIHTFILAIEPGKTTMYITINPVDTKTTNYRGRTGVYRITKGENYL